MTLTNPFPNGVAQPSGNSAGALLSGLNGDISFVDQNRSAPRVQQWSTDVQRELGGRHGDDGHLHGCARRPSAARRLERVADQHQPARSEIPRARQRGPQRLLPNPFFGNPNVPASLSTPTTLTRARLLDAVPAVRAGPGRQITEGVNTYNAGVVEFTEASEPRVGWPLQLHLQRAEGQSVRGGNFYAAPYGGNLPMNNYNYIHRRQPAARSGFHDRLL